MEQKQAKGKVSDTVGNIKNNSRHPVRKGCPPATDKKVGNCAQRAETQSEKSRYNAPEQDRAVLFEKEGDNSQNTPQIEIAEPPHSEPIQKAFQQHKNIDDKKDMAVEKQGVQDN